MITHCRLAMSKPSSSWADGSAIFTMVMSRTTISCATPMTARTHHRRAVRRNGRPKPFLAGRRSSRRPEVDDSMFSLSANGPATGSACARLTRIARTPADGQARRTDNRGVPRFGRRCV